MGHVLIMVRCVHMTQQLVAAIYWVITTAHAMAAVEITTKFHVVCLYLYLGMMLLWKGESRIDF